MRITNRAWALVLAVLALVPSQRIGGTVVVTHPYRGVTLTVRSETSPRVEHINVVQIDLTTPGLRFRVTDGNANQPSTSTLRETTAAATLSYLTSQNGQLAINAHFYQPNSTDANRWVVGLAASQGNIYSSFEGPTPATANPVNSLTLTQNYAIMTNAPALNIDAQNNAQIVHYDASYPDKKHVLEPVTLYNAVAGSAQIVTNGVTSIPTYTQNAATGLIDGNGWSASNSWYNATNARTAIGLTSDNHTLVLFTIDNAGGSAGMTIGEVADMMRNDYGVYNALNLDGGGSTTMALQDPVTRVRSVINTSSNGASPRVVASSLVVFADPEIAVEQPPGTNLTDGSATISCGSVNLGSMSSAFTFMVKNTGAADLTGLAVSKDGTNAADFTVGSLGAATLAPNTSTTFTVTFAPGAAGSRTAALHLASNDADENPFDISLTGTGVAVPEIAVEQPAGTNLTEPATTPTRTRSTFP
ncbi:MAG: phosphodiester glycosidase family protein [Verrucomicrobia bacterium]|nr:phosphodiester glycosidase family protein [Verrucomicrobiota bacterium]